MVVDAKNWCCCAPAFNLEIFEPGTTRDLLLLLRSRAARLLRMLLLSVLHSLDEKCWTPHSKTTTTVGENTSNIGEAAFLRIKKRQMVSDKSNLYQLNSLCICLWIYGWGKHHVFGTQWCSMCLELELGHPFSSYLETTMRPFSKEVAEFGTLRAALRLFGLPPNLGGGGSLWISPIWGINQHAQFCFAHIRVSSKRGTTQLSM